MKRFKSEITVWIGLVHAKPLPKRKFFADGTLGGYSHGFALAKNLTEFSKQINEALKEVGLKVIEIERPEPIEERVKWARLNRYLLALVSQVKESGEFRFGEWHTYGNDIEKGIRKNNVDTI